MPPDHAPLHLLIQPSGLQLSISSDRTLLEAALLTGVTLPSSCRNGTCRTCLCHLLSGQIRYQIDWPGLSAEEKAQGCILPCVAYPLSDLIIAMPGAAITTAELKAAFIPSSPHPKV